MNSTQNKNIEQVKETTMSVSLDVRSEKHYFRALKWRGILFIRKSVPFSNYIKEGLKYPVHSEGKEKYNCHLR